MFEVLYPQKPLLNPKSQRPNSSATPGKKWMACSQWSRVSDERVEKQKPTKAVRRTGTQRPPASQRRQHA